MTLFKRAVSLLKILWSLLLLHLFYFGIVPFFTFINFFDPLDKKQTSKTSFFKKRTPLKGGTNDFFRPF